MHRCEFSMLEWYRVDADYEDAIRDTIRIVRAACGAVADEEELVYGNRSYDLTGRWDEITMAEAFKLYAGVDSLTHEDLAGGLEHLGYSGVDAYSTEELFFRVYVEAVEPNLGVEQPTIVKDYPYFLGTMARSRENDPDTLERFEVYIAGLELANGYTELADSVELAGRMEKVLWDLSANGVRGLTVDDPFLEAMADLPPCAGVSMGMDRLAMLALNVQDIAQVTYPFEPNS